MTTPDPTRAAMQMALDGLRNLKVLLGTDSPEVRGWAPAVQQAAQKTVNAAISALRASLSLPAEGAEPRKLWRCFHCDEVFTDVDAATDHFGPAIYSDPACAIDAHRLRELESELARYRQEDTDLHRELHRKDSDHRQALLREEEKGYARGLRDGVNLPAGSPERAATPHPPQGRGAAGEGGEQTVPDDGEVWEQVARDIAANPRPIEEIKRDVAKVRERIDRAAGLHGDAAQEGGK